MTRRSEDGSRVALSTAVSTALTVTACLAGAGAAAQGQEPRLQPPADVQALEPIRVIGTMPVPGIDAATTAVPYNPQTISGEALDASRSQSVPDQLNSNMVGISLNTPQGNEHQATVLFRGFASSPLLGMPQGLSVFLDGMRLNEPFGDTVNWDLMPRNALASIQLSPGSNPVYGLNTLGGSLVLTTKSGRTHPGAAVEIGAGSYDRYLLGAEYGVSEEATRERASAAMPIIAAQVEHDGGWRDYSESRLASVFARTGIRSGCVAARRVADERHPTSSSATASRPSNSSPRTAAASTATTTSPATKPPPSTGTAASTSTAVRRCGSTPTCAACAATSAMPTSTRSRTRGSAWNRSKTTPTPAAKAARCRTGPASSRTSSA